MKSENKGENVKSSKSTGGTGSRLKKDSKVGKHKQLNDDAVSVPDTKLLRQREDLAKKTKKKIRSR